MGEDLVLSISPFPPRAWDEAIKLFPNQMLGLQNQTFPLLGQHTFCALVLLLRRECRLWSRSLSKH